MGLLAVVSSRDCNVSVSLLESLVLGIFSAFNSKCFLIIIVEYVCIPQF